MSCCDGWDYSKDDGVKGECPDCGEEAVDGSAIYGCNYSPVECETCGSAPCDLIC